MAKYILCKMTSMALNIVDNHFKNSQQTILNVDAKMTTRSNKIKYETKKFQIMKTRIYKFYLLFLSRCGAI